MNANVIASFAAGAVVGGGIVLALRPPTPTVSTTATHVPKQQQEAGTSKGKDASGFRYHSSLKYGPPSMDVMRFYSGFVACFDTQTRNPKWVIEHLDKDSIRGEADRKSSVFFEDEGVDGNMRNKLSAFVGSGYDRGHLAPAANHKSNQQAMDDTFTLSNISPQVGAGFNRNYWARFEKFTKSLVNAADNVYIVTGPLWMPKKSSFGTGWNMTYPLIGEPPSLVAVPTHFYKVVLAERSDEKGRPHRAVGAFVIPNQKIAPETPLTAYCVPLDSLEAVAGTKFFPNLLSQKQLAPIDSRAAAWRQHGKRAANALRADFLGGDAVAALPDGTETAAATTSGRSNASGKKGGGVPSKPPAPRRAWDGYAHLCDTSACELPKANFWEKKKLAANAASTAEPGAEEKAVVPAAAGGER